MYQNIEEIEFDNNLDFKDEIKIKYNNIIIEIFNGSNKYINTINTELQIILGLYYIKTKNYDKAYNILLFAHNIGDLDATCTLAIFYHTYRNNRQKAIEYFKYAADRGHTLAANNLAFEYLSIGEFDLFFKYNDIDNNMNNENALINHGIYLYNVLKDYDNSEECFNINNYRAYFEYSKLVPNIEYKKQLLIKAIKLKPKKIYIDMLKKITDDFERNELYKKNNINTNIFKNYDNNQFNITNNLNRFNRCPICINNNNYKIELITLKCNHSFCNDCIKKYCKKKCCIC
jgi:hypothetical protein